ncbi:hypothetical protein ACWKYK_13120, partial [Enterobacter hormaechei]
GFILCPWPEGPVGHRPDKYYPQVSLIQKVQFYNLESTSQNGITQPNRDGTAITAHNVTCYLSRHFF